MAHFILTTSPTSPTPYSAPFSPIPDYESMLSSPINISVKSRTLREGLTECDECEASSIITLSVDEVLEDNKASLHLTRMSGECTEYCLTASSGSVYSAYHDECGECEGCEECDNNNSYYNLIPQYQSPTKATADVQRTFEWSPFNDILEHPESVGWDSTSETQYSRSDTLSGTASVDYIKNALSAEIKSFTEKTSPPGQIVYHSSSDTNPDADASALDSVMLKRAETLQEVTMMERLNTKELRRDPWNPAAPLLAIVNADAPDDDAAILILERLQPHDKVPFKTVRDAVDLTKQLLQGLVFLHEHNIAHQAINPDSIMMEIGDAPTEESWDRSEYDVRYYLVDFSFAAPITDEQQIVLDLRHAAQSIRIVVGHTLPELSPLLRKMGHRESEQMTASQALQELESIVSSIPSTRMFAPLT